MRASANLHHPVSFFLQLSFLLGGETRRSTSLRSPSTGTYTGWIRNTSPHYSWISCDTIDEDVLLLPGLKPAGLYVGDKVSFALKVNPKGTHPLAMRVKKMRLANSHPESLIGKIENMSPRYSYISCHEIGEDVILLPHSTPTGLNVGDMVRFAVQFNEKTAGWRAQRVEKVKLLTGIIKNISPKYSHISCNEVGGDVLLLPDSTPTGLNVGDVVRFVVQENDRGSSWLAKQVEKVALTQSREF